MAALYIVATPIGNLADASRRMALVLAEVDIIAAEDTRRTGQLLQYLGIEALMIPFHAHNEHQSVDEIMKHLAAGKDLALVSDAGTPLISDPGFGLVKQCHEAGVPVVPIPGPSSVTTALSVAGLPTHRFSFEGFIPSKSSARKKYFRNLSNEVRTMVMFEAPHRIGASLDDLRDAMGSDRLITVCRELTKTYEQIVSTTVSEAARLVHEGEIPAKGEFVLVLNGSAGESDLDVDTLLTTLLAELPPSRAANLAARLTGQKKSQLYDRAMMLSEQLESGGDKN